MTSPDENQAGLLFRVFEGELAVTRDSLLFPLDGVASVLPGVHRLRLRSNLHNVAGCQVCLRVWRIVCSVYGVTTAPAGTGNVD